MELAVKHYSVEVYVTEDRVEFGTHSFKYHVETLGLGDINRTFITLPRKELVEMFDREIGKKSLKWFESLYKKLEKAIMELQKK